MLFAPQVTEVTRETTKPIYFNYILGAIQTIFPKGSQEQQPWKDRVD